MMKIIVFSDSHDTITHMFEAIEEEQPQMILHLGDHDYDCEDIGLSYPDITIRTVRGNCDRGSQGLDIDEFVCDGVRIVMTHGHLFGVKMSLGRLRDYAASRNAGIMLFGHTHRAVSEKWIDGISYLNPGSIGAGSKSYAVIELSNAVANCVLKRLP